MSGVDDHNGGSDTNILVAVDAENDYIYGVSIPRDTKAVINGKNHKINFAYNSGGTALLAETISQQLGIPVDFTVTVDLDGFAALVNAIGGVDFEVPISMNYDDPYQDLHIHFSAGMQHLSGAEALKVVRFRHNNDGSGYGSEDIGRMQTQQNFLKAVAQQTLTLSNVDKVGGVRQDLPAVCGHGPVSWEPGLGWGRRPSAWAWIRSPSPLCPTSGAPPTSIWTRRHSGAGQPVPESLCGRTGPWRILDNPLLEKAPVRVLVHYRQKS